MAKGRLTKFDRTLHAVGDTTYLKAIAAGLDEKTAKELAAFEMWKKGIELEKEALEFQPAKPL